MRDCESGKRVKLSSAQSADIGPVSIGGAAPAVCSGYERRNSLLLCAGGVLRMPEAGEEAAILILDDGTTLVLGAPVYTVPQGLKNGEICIKAGEAEIRLLKSGEIEISGDVKINGSLSLNGGIVNGA